MQTKIINIAWLQQMRSIFAHTYLLLMILPSLFSSLLSAINRKVLFLHDYD